MKKIKILYIGLSSNLGGIETYLHNLFEYMDKSKFEINFLVFKGKKVCFYDELKKSGIKISHTIICAVFLDKGYCKMQ